MDGYFKHITEVRSVPLESLDLFRKSIDFYINSLSQEEQQHWNEKQAYIVLGQLMFAAALEEVDSCPMEGFDENIMNEILNLDSATETATVTLAFGIPRRRRPFSKFNKSEKTERKTFQVFVTLFFHKFKAHKK